MKRRLSSSINIWPGFVDVISTLLLVFVFLLALFMVSQTFLTQVLSGKNIALENLKNKLFKLDSDLKINESEKGKLSEEIFQLNKKLEKLNLYRIDVEKELLQEEELSEKYLLISNELEIKVKSLSNELGIEKLKLSEEKTTNKNFKLDIKKLNNDINELNTRLAELDKALSLSLGTVEDKDLQLKNLKNKLDIAIQEKIGELSEYRSEFFGKLKKVIGQEKEIIIVGDRFVLQSEIFFTSGSSLVEETGKSKIIEIANLLKSITIKIPKNIDWLIQVEGHTDNVPIANKEYPSNWELSTARAISVAKIMIENGIQSKRINVAGYGEFRPLVENNSKSNREKNRRIELKLTQP